MNNKFKKKQVNMLTKSGKHANTAVVTISCLRNHHHTKTKYIKQQKHNDSTSTQYEAITERNFI